jgi:hypothetical protein
MMARLHNTVLGTVTAHHSWDEAGRLQEASMLVHNRVAELDISLLDHAVVLCNSTMFACGMQHATWVMKHDRRNILLTNMTHVT